jgi:cytidylate kinase
MMAVVTISQMPGALGDEIGAALAERLRYRLVNRQQLACLAAMQPRSRPEPAWEHALTVTERPPSLWERLSVERRDYARVLRRAVVALAEQDQVVIVGLGAGQVLRGLHHTLCVLVVASEELRLARLMDSAAQTAPAHPRTQEEARALLRRRERATDGYMRYVFQIDWLDCRQWDLVLNAGRFSISSTVALLAGCVESGRLAPGDEDRRRLRNLTLAGRVEAALSNHDGVRVEHLDVRAHDGRVVLEGLVPAEQDRALAEATARGVEGVVAVQNELRVYAPFVVL